MLARPSLARCVASAIASVVLASGVATMTATEASAAADGYGALSGVYAGGLQVDAAKAFGAWRGRPVTVTSDFLPGGSWADLEAPDWWTGSWAGSGTRMVVGVPILPGAAGSTTLAQGATGAYDAHFRTLATKLIAAGMSDAVLRLGWEQNGNWFAWSANGHETDYIAYWRHIVTAMRSVSGAHFAFAFNPTLGAGQYGSHPDQAWPGDAYVDTIALDVYDSMWGNSTATPEQRWAAVQQGTYNLDWWASFAAAHGNLPLSFPEWGLVARADQNGGGGGDNPLFITNFLSWVRSHHVLCETYFEVTAQDGDHLLQGSAFPKAAAAYRAAVTAPVSAPPAAETSPTPAPTAAPAAAATVASTVAPTVAPTVAATVAAAPAAIEAPTLVATPTPSTPAVATPATAPPADPDPPAMTTSAPSSSSAAASLTTPGASGAIAGPMPSSSLPSPAVTAAEQKLAPPVTAPLVTVVAPQAPLVTVTAPRDLRLKAAPHRSIHRRVRWGWAQRMFAALRRHQHSRREPARLLR